MKKNNIIEFNPKRRVLEKAEKYAEFPELFLEDQDKALPLLIKAARHAKGQTRLSHIIQISLVPCEASASFFLEILHDPEEDEEFRMVVANYLKGVLEEQDDPGPMIDLLLDDIRDPNPEIRAQAATALSFEGNTRAAIPLTGLLFDVDEGVQEAAAGALANLGDDSIYPLFLDRMEHGSRELKRCLLHHLWLFKSRLGETRRIYLKYTNHPDPEFRLDAILLLATLNEPDGFPDVYDRCLNDPDPRIREVCIERIRNLTGRVREEFQEKIDTMRSDPCESVRKAAALFFTESIPF